MINTLYIALFIILVVGIITLAVLLYRNEKFTKLPTPPIPGSQNLLLSDKDGNLNIVKTDDYNSYLSAINTQLTQKLDAMQVQLDAMQVDLDKKVSYNHSISLALDHSQTDGMVPRYPGGTTLYNLADIDKKPETRQYLSYETQNWGSGQTIDGCVPGKDGKCNAKELRPNIISGKPIKMMEGGKISNHQSSNFKIVPGLIKRGDPPITV
jgi:hypothetical protein